jgi:hypothetical protein
MNKKLFSMALLFAVLLSGIGVIPVLAQSVSPASDFEYDLNGDGTGVVILKYVGKGGDIVIPDSIEDFPVVSVGCGFDNENVKTPQKTFVKSKKNDTRHRLHGRVLMPLFVTSKIEDAMRFEKTREENL